MSKFFKSTWFKCISVLLALAVILGGTLAILNDVLYVSDTERTQRALKKIYGVEVNNYSTVLDTSLINQETGENFPPIIYTNLGEINKIFTIEQDTLFQTTGYNGYKGGTVTLWIKVITTESGSKIIDKVILEDSKKQSLISYLSSSPTYFNNFLVDITETYENGEFTSDSKYRDQPNYNPVSGATYSAIAGCNAVNCVMEYYKEGAN